MLLALLVQWLAPSSDKCVYNYVKAHNPQTVADCDRLCVEWFRQQ